MTAAAMDEIERPISDRSVSDVMPSDDGLDRNIIKTGAAAINPRRIGGSDVPAILGMDPWGKTGFDVYLRIVEGVQNTRTPSMQKGLRFERSIGDWFSDETGVSIRWVGGSIEPPDRPWQRLSPDVLIESERSIGDIKRYKNARAFLGVPGTDEIGPYEMLQLHTYIEGVNHLRELGLYAFESGAPAERWRLIVHDLLEDDLALYRGEYSEQLGAMITEECERFWTDHIIRKSPPEISGSSSVRAWLEGRFPKAAKPPRIATAEECALALRWRELNADQDKIEAELDVIKNKLRESIGDHERVRGDFGSISWTDIPGGPVTYERKPYRKLAPYFRKVK